jgi:hypothetical protein
VCALVDPKALATEREHLGHERHAVELPVVVERAQDFVLASDFDPVTYPEFGNAHIQTRC